jgi:PAS domain S-box-containing protein
MAGKLRRFSSTTQEGLKLLACLGNVAEIASLALVQGTTEEAIHAALWQAVRGGLVFREDSAYKFPHDRIQQAAYVLIPEDRRAEVHLRIGRVMLKSFTADELTQHLFDVANHFNRGATLLADRDEKAQVAAINLRAGRKAKASTAYASALACFSTGMALLDERDWGHQYELTFSLSLERAECELLSGNFENAERLIVELLQRGTSKVDQAAVYRLKVQSHVMKSENQQAVASALTCLRLFGLDLPAHPTQEQVQAEYETVWQTLNGRPIESLIDLPLMTDPELQATLQVLSVLTPAALFTDIRLYRLLVCRMVTISMQHGTSGASAQAFGYWGSMLGPVFHRYSDARRFAKLACDLVEKHGFIAYQAKVYYTMGRIAFWTQPIATAIDFMRATFRAAIETGDLTFACYGMFQSVMGLLLRNDPLDVVWRESEVALEFARQAKYGDAEDIIGSQLHFIATMLGRTTTFSTFSDAQFDEAEFEAQLTGVRMPLMICWYWILKLKARFLSGDYAEALAAAEKAKALLSAAAAQIQLLDYFYYAALTVAACYENASADEQQEWRELLTAHEDQLREWSDSYPPTFADKHALVLAEIARLEGRDAGAMRLYEQAIRLARENGFVQNEGVAHELAAGFYLGRGSTTAARAHVEDARSCFARWGALGKVRQLDQRYPRLREKTAPSPPTATIGAPIEQLDIGTVVKASHTLSGEIELGKLVETLMRIMLEHAGAERGLLILFPGDEPRIEAEATTGRGQVEVTLRQTAASPAELPESVLHYVIRTRESIILDDALAQNPFSADEYICQKRARSVLCLPLVKQSKLIGVLYLENNLASHVFTPERISVLELLASQAAISLENARLYSDLGEREARIRRLVDSNIIGIVIGDVQGRIIEANQAFLDIVGYAREDLVSGRLRWTELTPAEWRDADDQALAQLKAAGTVQPREKEYFRKDGSRVPVLVGATTFGDRQDQGVAFVLDLTERKRADYLTRQVFERSPDRISIVGRDYRYQRVNSAFERRWGMPAETIVGMHVADLLGMEAFEQMAKAYLDRCFAGEEVSYADWLTTPLGRRYSAVTYSPLRPESERVEATLVIIRDLTEHVLASEALREAQAELAHVTRVTMLGELTASIAHEVNQPLATVVTFGDACLRWLDREVPRIDKARSAVEQMIGSARHASDVIERIRALSKRRPFESVRLDINQVIDDVVVLIRREINLHSISLRLDLGASLPPVDGDRIQLQQVITNLLMNGIQAMSAVTDRDRELRIRSRVHGSDQMLITVEDSGIGIGPEHARLFNAFFTTKPDGMGMGLSICRSIIEAHDGRLWAKANVPHGATFLFTLPLNVDSVS